ncbi:MAG TPA: cyclic nucleotide-binding domain-containing protein [Actinomycetota bacterium]
MRRGASKIKLLEQVPMFSALTQSELRHVAAVTQPVSVPADAVVAKEGEPGKDFFVIIDGTTEVVIGGRSVAELGPGDFFGEMALLDQSPRVGSVVARTPVDLYRIEARDFSRLIDEVPFLGKKLLRGLALRIRQTEKAPQYVWNRL